MNTFEHGGSKGLGRLKVEAERMTIQSHVPEAHCVCTQTYTDPSLLSLGLLQKSLFYPVLVPGRQDLNYRAIKIIRKKSLMCICYHMPVISILCLALNILFKSSW